MAMVDEVGILLGIKPIDFINKQNGESVKFLKIVLARQAFDPQYDGYGLVVYDLMVPGAEGLAKLPDFLHQSKDLFLKKVVVTCESYRSGKNRRDVPISIAAYQPSVSSAPPLAKAS
jgi:hypothetical protein